MYGFRYIDQEAQIRMYRSESIEKGAGKNRGCLWKITHVMRYALDVAQLCHELMNTDF